MSFPAGILLSGTFTYCGVGQPFSLQFGCFGNGCEDLFNFPNVSCTPALAVSFFGCTNSVTCPGPTNYTSQFLFNQSTASPFATLVTQAYNITNGCQEIELTNDGFANAPGGGGTQLTITNLPGCAATSASSSSTTTSSVLYGNSSTALSATPPIKTGQSGLTTTTTIINGVTTTICPGLLPSTTSSMMNISPTVRGGSGVITPLTSIPITNSATLTSYGSNSVSSFTNTASSVAGSSPLSTSLGQSATATPLTSIPVTNSAALASYGSNSVSSFTNTASSVTGSSPLSTSLGQSATASPLTSTFSSPSQPFVATSSATPRYESKFARIYILLLACFLLTPCILCLSDDSLPSVIQKPSAEGLATVVENQDGPEELPTSSQSSKSDLRARAISPIPSPYLSSFVQLLTTYVNATVEATEPGNGTLATDILTKVENNICNIFTTNQINLVPPPDIIAGCISVVVSTVLPYPPGGTVFAGPEELLVVFSAGILCNYLFAEFESGGDAVKFCNGVP